MLLDQIKLIKEYTGNKSYAKSREDSILGLEFENELLNEDINFPTSSLESITGWKVHNENSLRHFGVEFVSKPTRYSDYKKSVENLFDSIRSITKCKKIPFTNSIRTSVHVHFDVGALNTLEVVNFTTLYWILEPFLQHFCGKYRQGNLFCLRAKDSSYMRLELSKILKSYSAIFNTNLVGESYRYGSVNFNSLSKFGTLEFRIMRGVSHENPAFIWIDALEKIRQFSLKFKNPVELRDWFLKDVNAEEVPITILGAELFVTLQRYLPEGASIKSLIREGYLSVIPVLSAQSDYSEAKLKKEQETIEKQFSDIKKAQKYFTVSDTSTTSFSYEVASSLFAQSAPISTNQPVFEDDILHEYPETFFIQGEYNA